MKVYTHMNTQIQGYTTHTQYILTYINTHHIHTNTYTNDLYAERRINSMIGHETNVFIH